MGSYLKKLKHPKWQKKRLEILNRDNWTCVECGATELTLHVHHLKYKGADPWDTPSKYLETLCEDCHKNEHKKAPTKKTRKGGASSSSTGRCLSSGADNRKNSPSYPEIINKPLNDQDHIRLGCIASKIFLEGFSNPDTEISKTLDDLIGLGMDVENRGIEINELYSKLIRIFNHCSLRIHSSERLSYTKEYDSETRLAIRVEVLSVVDIEPVAYYVESVCRLSEKHFKKAYDFFIHYLDGKGEDLLRFDLSHNLLLNHFCGEKTANKRVFNVKAHRFLSFCGIGGSSTRYDVVENHLKAIQKELHQKTDIRFAFETERYERKSYSAAKSITFQVAIDFNRSASTTQAALASFSDTPAVKLSFVPSLQAV